MIGRRDTGKTAVDRGTLFARQFPGTDSGDSARGECASFLHVPIYPLGEGRVFSPAPFSLFLSPRFAPLSFFPLFFFSEYICVFRARTHIHIHSRVGLTASNAAAFSDGGVFPHNRTSVRAKLWSPPGAAGPPKFLKAAAEEEDAETPLLLPVLCCSNGTPRDLETCVRAFPLGTARAVSSWCLVERAAFRC